MNHKLRSSHYAGRQTALGASVVAFSPDGECLGIVRRAGIPNEKPIPIGEEELETARRSPRFFQVIDENGANSPELTSEPESELGSLKLTIRDGDGAPVFQTCQTIDARAVEVEGKAVVDAPEENSAEEVTTVEVTTVKARSRRKATD